MFFLSYIRSNLKTLLPFGKFVLNTVILFGLVLKSVGCGVSKTIWKNHGDSCISISETPPLKRVINYTDHDLCERKLSPRKAPNPQTRPTEPKK